MKVQELMEKLEILNPKHTVYGTFEKGNCSHNKFNIERVDISKGNIILLLDNFPQH